MTLKELIIKINAPEHLLESISIGYDLIFESFEEVAQSVLDAYNQLLHISDIPTPNANKSFTLNVTMDRLVIDAEIKFGYDMNCRAIPPNKIILPISDLWQPLMLEDLNKFKRSISTPEIRYMILHELGHIYEFSKRTPADVSKQLSKLTIKREDLDISDKEYHNNRTEHLANNTSTVLYRILDAINNGITNPNDMYSFVIKNIQRDSEIQKGTHLGRSINSFNLNNMNKIKKRIANIVYQISKESDLTQIARIVSDGMSND